MDDGVLQLVDAARAGDRLALERLIERCSGVAGALARARCANHAEAEDVLQESLLEVCQSISRLQQGASFWAWLRGIVWHNATDRQRRGQARREAPLEAADGVAASTPPGDVALEIAEGRDRLLAELARLPDAEREMMLLRHEAGLSLEQIAEATGTTMRAVESRLFRARQTLRQRVFGRTERGR